MQGAGDRRGRSRDEVNRIRQGSDLTETQTNQLNLFSYHTLPFITTIQTAGSMTEDIGEGTLGVPVPDDNAGPSRPTRRPNATILRTLTFTQNVSAAVFSVFVPMHFASPIAAAFGGSAAADKVLVSILPYSMCLY